MQIASGWISDVLGLVPLIVTGMLLRGGVICLADLVTSIGTWTRAMVLLRLGTARVYPTLLAATGNTCQLRREPHH